MTTPSHNEAATEIRRPCDDPRCTIPEHRGSPDFPADWPTPTAETPTPTEAGNDVGRYLPCPVCKGDKSHHANCPVPVLGPPKFCTCEHAEVDRGTCVLCERGNR